VFFALLAYLLAIALFAMYQKHQLLQDFDKMQQAIDEEAVLSQAHVSIYHTIGALTANFDEAGTELGMRRIAMHQQLFLRRQASVTERFPQRIRNAVQVNAAFARANEQPSQANMKLLIGELMASETDLESAIEAVRAKRQSLTSHYRAQSDSATITVLLLGALGLLFLGATIGWFFRRLVADLQTLQRAALDVARGVRGQPIAVRRNDEVGQLMQAINSMGDTLDHSARALMLERKKYFHQEKMAAIGTLAAGIAHEIGNPIAAITGVAQEMIDRRAQGHGTCNAEGCAACHPELIYAQTSRLASITREISVFAAPSATEAQLLDLNAIVRSTASLVRYDKRLHNIRLDLALDPQLPAFEGVADQLTQLIMNLLINAMDALQGVAGRAPQIVVQTGFDARQAHLFVNDNGCGMSAQTLSRVFEAFFTTKAVGQGTGLGLSLCYSIVQAHGGNIEIQSQPDQGTQVQVFFPLEASHSKHNH